MKRAPQQWRRAGHPSTWGQFDPKSEFDAGCERERKRAIGYIIKRLKTCKPDEQVQIVTGYMMAAVQLMASMAQSPILSAEQQDALHEMLDFCITATNAWGTKGGMQ